MTYEEVKKIRNNGQVEHPNIRELQELIDIAIEKQIPKEPLMHGICPNCGIDFDVWNYCPVCGQKIDWGKLKPPYDSLGATIKVLENSIRKSLGIVSDKGR